MSPAQASVQTELVFIDSTPESVRTGDGRREARKKIVRSQATRASTHARLATFYSRAEGRPRQPGQRVFRAHVEPPPTSMSVDEQQHTPTSRHSSQQSSQLSSQRSSPERESALALHANTLLGGPIPAAQANIAILAQFLNRFATGSPSDRPWVQLVMGEASSSSTPSLVTMALQANASALCANDLQEPEIRRHATRLYLSAIRRVQLALKSSQWQDPVVMYTCMILTLFETIQSKDPSASHAHVGGVAMLIQQKGPQSFVHGLEHRTFRYYRINIVMMRLAERRHCFLAELEWKAVPFSGDCPPKTILDRLLDILAEIPGVLSAVEILTSGILGQWATLQKAFELVYWLRRLISDLESWKHDCIYTYSTICKEPDLKTLDLLALCKLGTGQIPYDPRLGEALNCYAASHLILTRIAQRMAERSFIIATALRPTYTLRELVAAIVLVSERHISNGTADMISVIVTTFPLKVAQGVEELEEPELFGRVRKLLEKVNTHVARKYNIHYSVSGDTREYEV